MSRKRPYKNAKVPRKVAIRRTPPKKIDKYNYMMKFKQSGIRCGNCGTYTMMYDPKLHVYECSECHTKENR